MTSKLLVDFGVSRDTPGQVQKHRMVQVYENEIYESNILKKSKWGGEDILVKRGWARFTNFKGDRLVPKSEYADPSDGQKKKWKKLSHSVALAEACSDARNAPPVPQRRKSAIVIAEEAGERRKAMTAQLEPAIEEEAGAETLAQDADDDDDDASEEVDEIAEYGDDTSEVDSEEEESELQFWNPVCPEGYEWITAWKINRLFMQTAEGGWIYGNNLAHIINMQVKLRSRATPSGSYARRRLWYRIMARIDVDPILPKPFILPLRMISFFDTTESKESTFLLNTYENQRWSPILLGWGNKFPGHLLFHDPAAVTNASGKQRVKNWSDLDALPPGFRWASEWTVDERPGVTGENGFLYATDFPSFYGSGARVHLENSTAMSVRRRRWVRRMVPFKEHVRKEIELDPMPLPALFPSSGLLRPLHGKSVRRGLHHVDLILVHGLAGDARDTFKGPIRLSESETFWPAEFLLSDDKFTSVYGVPAASKLTLAQSVRTLVVEHGLYLDVLDPMWTMDNAVKLLSEALRSALVGCRPIVWIGHSIGGLLIKELLHHSFKSGDNALFALTRGVVFLATPHHGASSINTILDMRIARKSTTTDYLKPCMHFHEMQAWFDATDIEYVNIVENADIPSRRFSGVFANLLMKFVGLRIVQVNDGMLTMGSEPSDDLETPIRYNYLADLDHWVLGAMKLGNPVYDKVYSLIRLAVARWLRVKNNDCRTAWLKFTKSLSKELALIIRLMYEISRTNSPITRTISALEHKTNPSIVVKLMKKLTAGSPRQAKLERLTSIRELDSDNLDRMEDYLRERPEVESFVGKYRIDIESKLCILFECVPEGDDREDKWDELVQGFSTSFLAVICTEDIDSVKDIMSSESSRGSRLGEMIFWIELARCCKELLGVKGSRFPRDSDYSNEDIEACIERVHHRLMDAISEVNQSVRASVESELNRAAAVVRASMVANNPPPLPSYAPPPPPSGLEAGRESVPPPVPASQPQYKIGKDDDDLEVVTVPAPPVPSLPPPGCDHAGAKLVLGPNFIGGSNAGDDSPMVMVSPIGIERDDSDDQIPSSQQIEPIEQPGSVYRKQVIDDDDDLDIVKVAAAALSPSPSDEVSALSENDEDK